MGRDTCRHDFEGGDECIHCGYEMDIYDAVIEYRKNHPEPPDPWIYVDNAEMKGRYKVEGNKAIYEITYFLKVTGSGSKTFTLPFPESK